jgi:hypothetical protein
MNQILTVGLREAVPMVSRERFVPALPHSNTLGPSILVRHKAEEATNYYTRDASIVIKGTDVSRLKWRLLRCTAR